MLKKSEVRQAIRNFASYWSQLPKNKLERKIELWYRGIWLGFGGLLIYILKDGILMLVALGLILLWLIYQMSTGR